jgi:hypothetical protein
MSGLAGFISPQLPQCQTHYSCRCLALYHAKLIPLVVRLGPAITRGLASAAPNRRTASCAAVTHSHWQLATISDAVTNEAANASMALQMLTYMFTVQTYQNTCWHMSRLIAGARCQADGGRRQQAVQPLASWP